MKFIVRVIEDLKNNTMEKGARFSHSYFMHKGFKTIGREGSDALTKYMDQIYSQIVFEPIYITDLSSQESRRSQEGIIILEQKSTKKNSKE